MKKIELSKLGRTLILSPHPDDESLGCGGLLIKNASRCEVVVLTDGRYGGLLKENKDEVIVRRKKELEEAMKFVGLEKYSFLDIEDGKLSKNFSKFAKLNLEKFDTIFCPAPGENHSDHACVFNFILKLKPKARIFAYEVWSTLEKPSHYIDISDLINKKKKLINLYKSQLSQVDYLSRIISLNHYRGMQVYPAIPYLEAYQELVL
ncbi:MAG: PIG-L family deacetylase [Patescibacteria group bacterium]|jgi:LmbE family N-acetylglucosaminyl deacetylase